MNKKTALSMRSKIFLCIGILFMVLMLMIELVRLYGIPFTDFKGGRRAFKEEAFRNFSIVADLQKNSILTWIEERKRNMRVMSIALENDLSEITALIRSFKEQGMAGDVLWQALQREPPYKRMLNYLMARKQVYEIYHELKITDEHSGATIISTNPDDTGKKLYEKQFSRGEASPDGFLFDISPCHFFPQKTDLVISCLVGSVEEPHESGMLLVSHISLNDFLTPVIQASAVLGKTGEIVLVDRERKVLTPLKYPLKDGRMPVALIDTIDTLPAMRAARGEEGVIEALDYRGVAILAAYRSIALSPKQQWGMVVKRDKKAVYSYLEHSAYYSALINLFGILLGFLIIFLISGDLTRPIRQLAEAAGRVEQNDFSVRVEVTAKDEIGLLAAAFNKMIGKIENWKSELEMQVRNRTAELHATNQQLRASEQQLKASNQQLKASQQQLKAGNEQLVLNEQRLRAEITHREEMEKETHRHLQELQIFFKASVNREERILDLKNKVKELEEWIKKKDPGQG